VGKLEAAAPVAMVALGGSMIAGEGCHPGHDGGVDNGVDPRGCAYPSRFSRWLNDTYYGPNAATATADSASSNLFYENRALGGTTTAGALPMLPLLVRDHRDGHRGMDLIVIDFSVNDFNEEQDWTTTSATTQDADQEEKVFAATEAMLRYLLRKHSSSAIMLVDGMCVSHSPAMQAHARAADAYGVPFLPSSGLMPCGSYGRHPPNFVHEFLKAGLVMWWQTFTWLVSCPEQSGSGVGSSSGVSTGVVVPPLDAAAPEAVASRFKVCEKLRTVYDAQAAYAQAQGGLRAGAGVDTGARSSLPVSVKGSWPLALDNGRADKAAWITTESFSVLDFPLAFGQSPRVAMVRRNMRGCGRGRGRVLGQRMPLTAPLPLCFARARFIPVATTTRSVRAV